MLIVISPVKPLSEATEVEDSPPVMLKSSTLTVIEPEMLPLDIDNSALPLVTCSPSTLIEPLFIVMLFDNSFDNSSMSMETDNAVSSLSISPLTLTVNIGLSVAP